MGVVLGAEERSPRKNFRVLLEFLAGRLAGYLCFGLLVGYLGEMLDPRWLRRATDVSFIVLSVVLLLYLLGLVREKNFCRTPPWLKNSHPAFMGFFMGINVCPPFLLSVAYVFSQHNPLYGAVYFALFFLASSVYFLPIVFIGLASRAREFRTVARASGILIAVIFFIYGVYSMIRSN
jgi:sulfite exporter TauE/SafE